MGRWGTYLGRNGNFRARIALGNIFSAAPGSLGAIRVGATPGVLRGGAIAPPKTSRLPAPGLLPRPHSINYCWQNLCRIYIHKKLLLIRRVGLFYSREKNAQKRRIAIGWKDGCTLYRESEQDSLNECGIYRARILGRPVEYCNCSIPCYQFKRST